MNAGRSHEQLSTRALARQTATLSPAPGQPPRPMPIGPALDAARAAIGSGAPEVAQHLAAQLKRVPGAMTVALVLELQALLYLGRAADALTIGRRLATLGVSEPDDVLAVVRALQFSSRHAEAMALLNAALARPPRSAALRHCRAEMLGEIGDAAEAAAELRALLADAPGLLASWRTLAMLDRLSDAELQRLEALPLGNVDVEGRIAVWSALAFSYRQRGQPDLEFSYLDRAQQLLAAQDPWVPAEETEQADAVIAELDADFFRDRASPPATPGPRPIFVLGMPRSGSTLAEQIIVSCEGVEAAGESGVFPWLLLDLAERRYGTAPWPDIALRLTPQDLQQLRQDYFGQIQRVFTRAPVFVDKQFTNWKYLGLLALVLPEALFVHTVRDPLDSCLSTYQQAFHALGYGHDLRHLALIERDQDRVMAHWRSLFPERIHSLGYEELVANPEREIRRLLEFCRLPWTDRALRFHETRRGVRTASVMQVRRPIYRSSVAKWQGYAHLLKPAREILGR